MSRLDRFEGRYIPTPEQIRAVLENTEAAAAVLADAQALEDELTLAQAVIDAARAWSDGTSTAGDSEVRAALADYDAKYPSANFPSTERN